MGTPGVASTPHTLYLPLTATPTSSPRLPYIPFLPSPPSLLLHLFYPKKRLWMFRWMIHGLDRWLMDALSSVRSPYLPPGGKSQIPPLHFRPHHKNILLGTRLDYSSGLRLQSARDVERRGEEIQALSDAGPRRQLVATNP